MRYLTLTLLFLVLKLCCNGQTEPHYTMFMFNKLVYNPAYAGSKDVYAFNANYRNQWLGIPGAPKTFNFSIDAPVKSPPLNKVALGFGVNNEQIGVLNSTDLKLYYAYRVFFEKHILSMGLSAGGRLYSTNFGGLNPYQANDPNTYRDFKNKFLPNAGVGVFWKDAAAEKFYIGLSVPNLLQNYYNKNTNAKQIRGYYFSGGYILPLDNANIKLEPQFVVRYIYNDIYRLPWSCDINLSAIIYDRLLLGLTYRTDKSLEAIVHLQVTSSINVGYAFDYLLSDLTPYYNGTHEIIVGYDLPKGSRRYLSPHFIKSF